MNLLFFVELFYPYVFGGGEYIFFLIIRELARKGHNVQVVTQMLHGTKQYEIFENIRIHRVGSEIVNSDSTLLPPTIRNRTGYLLSASRKGRKIILESKKKGQNIDLIHSNLYLPALSGHICSSFYRIPHIVTFHDVFLAHDKNFWKDWMSKQIGGDTPFYASIFAKQKNADIMITLDSDGQHDPDDIPRIIDPILNRSFDIVIGSRFLGHSNKSTIPAYRDFGIRTITRLTDVASHNNLTDAQSGFRGYGKQAITKINLFEQGMSISTEILLQAKENNLLIKEIPITIDYDVENPSTHNPLSHGIGVVYSLIQFISLRHPLAFYGLPGITFVIIAVFFMYFALGAYFLSKHSLTESLLATASMEYIVIAVGFGIVGIVLLATGAILYTITALLKGKIKDI